MKGPYENNKVYAVAAHPTKGLKAGFVSAVFAQVKSEYSGTVSDDPRNGRFFMVGPDENYEIGGNADHWNPEVGEDALLVLPEAEDPLDLLPTHVLSTWSDREGAWAAFEGRRIAGRKGAQTRSEREAEAQEAKRAAERQAREESPLGRIKKATKGIEHAFVVPARNGHQPFVMLQMRVTPDKFRRMMATRGVEVGLVEEFLADDNDLL